MEYNPVKQFFEGWYYKQQAGSRTLAVIPGRTSSGAFVQVVTEKDSRNIQYPLSAYVKSGGGLRIGSNTFSNAGVTLDIRDGEFTLSGSLMYRSITPLVSDIMGPFKFFPMECRHGVASMRHTVSGFAVLNGEELDFNGGVGYIESDSGRSFPQGYSWIQSNDFGGGASVMASVARIPFLGMKFCGCIAVVLLNNREYRLATYKGARILQCEHGIIELKQGILRLCITVRADDGHPLAAPERGVMRRTIYESASCPAHFRFTMGNTVLFDEESRCASYECMTL